MSQICSGRNNQINRTAEIRGITMTHHMAFRALIVGLMVFLSGAVPAQAATPEWLPSLVDSAALDTQALVSGEVVRPDGSPFPAGSKVEVVAYPSSSVVGSMKVGDSIQVIPVAKAFVGASGKFVVRLDSGLGIERFAASNGLVDFEVRIINDPYYAAYSFSVDINELNKLQEGVESVVSDRADLMGVVLTALPANKKLHLLEAAVSGPVNKTDICGEVLVSNLGVKAVAIGATYTGGAGRTGSLTFTSGSTSSLGVGLSASGAYGTYESSGTVERVSTSTVTFAAGSGGRLYQSYFSYGKYGQYCYPVGSSYDEGDIYVYKVRASSFAGGSAIVPQQLPVTLAVNCVPLASGSSFVKSATTASTFSAGAALSASIGINLSSRTGYTTTTKATFTNSSGSSRSLCGVNGTPATAAGLLVLK